MHEHYDPWLELLAYATRGDRVGLVEYMAAVEELGYVAHSVVNAEMVWHRWMDGVEVYDAWHDIAYAHECRRADRHV